MTVWFLLFPVGVVLFVLAVLLRRRAELHQYRHNLAERALARSRGSHLARLQHPAIDLAKCIGCGACVRACPEDGVLALAHGQAVVVHGARCVGHGRCAEACPTGAIALTLGDLSQRKDLPAVDGQLEAVTVPGLFLAGEITGFALVRTAVLHGAQVATAVARRVAAAHRVPAAVAVAAGASDAAPAARGGADLDLVIVGLGPAGLSCALGARQRGLQFACLEQAAEVGGTVAAYPRRKMVMTQPVDLPLHGRLSQTSYQKEELVELWRGLAAEHGLPVTCGAVVQNVARGDDGVFTVQSSAGALRAANVCLALGRRGSPRKLGVPGEELAKVSYSLLDAESYQDRDVLVVGGGDSAVEAALALAEQGSNRVALSYRKEAFVRLKARNEARIQAALADGSVRALFGSEVARIGEHEVELTVRGGDAGGRRTLRLPNDEVFVFAGGTPPFALLEAAGVSFDPALRPAEAPAVDAGGGLLLPLAATLAGTLALLAVRVLGADYYDLPLSERAASPWDGWLRPQGLVGLWAATAAVVLFASNLCYLARRSAAGSRLPGTLRGWMSMHIATGIGALLCACLHSGFAARDSVGGHALLAMAVVVAAGVVGRWFYAFVPRAQNGRQADLEELGSRVAALAGEWDRHGGTFSAEVREHVEAMVAGVQFGPGFLSRVWGLVRNQWRLQRRLRALRHSSAAAGVPEREIQDILLLARRAHRLALQVVHYEEVRGLLASWRFLHRWLALLLLLLVVLHVLAALRFGGVRWSALLGGGA